MQMIILQSSVYFLVTKVQNKIKQGRPGIKHLLE